MQEKIFFAKEFKQGLKPTLEDKIICLMNKYDELAMSWTNIYEQCGESDRDYSIKAKQLYDVMEDLAHLLTEQDEKHFLKKC